MFHTVEIDFSALTSTQALEVPLLPSLQEIAAGSQSVIVLNNVIASADFVEVKKRMAHLVTHLEGSTFSYDVFKGDHHLGGQPNYQDYLRQCARHDQRLREITGFDFATFFHHIFSGLSGDNAIRPKDRNILYKSAILKAWHNGKELRAHYDSVLDEHEPGQFLKSLGNTKQILSFVLVLEVPEKGGELVIYDASKEDVPQTLLPLSPTHQALLGQYLDRKVKYQEIKPKANSLILFKGGDAFHRVRPSHGEGKRLTIGGLMMPSFDGKTMYYWG